MNTYLEMTLEYRVLLLVCPSIPAGFSASPYLLYSILQTLELDSELSREPALVSALAVHLFVPILGCEWKVFHTASINVLWYVEVFENKCTKVYPDVCSSRDEMVDYYSS